MLCSLLEMGWDELADVVVGFLLWALIAWARRVHASLGTAGAQRKFSD